jgi:hypothetical protein
VVRIDAGFDIRHCSNSLPPSRDRSYRIAAITFVLLVHTVLLRPFFTLLSCLLLASCSTIATYDQIAYEKATDAKAEALLLMDRATGAFSSHETEIQSVNLTLEKAYEYDRGRAQNSITVKQWEILLDPNRNLFGGFIRRWREKGSLRPAYIAEKKTDIAEAFDQIIELERGKPKSQ